MEKFEMKMKSADDELETMDEARILAFESVMIKVEREEQDDGTEIVEQVDVLAPDIDVQGNPVKPADKVEQCDTLICGLPAPDTEMSDQELRDFEINSDSNIETTHSSLNEESQFKCEVCLKVFDAKTKLSQHKKYVHIKRQHVCDECNKSFKTKSHLNRHILTHLNDGPSEPEFQCKECKNKYRTLYGLRLHVRSLHRGVKFTCDICNRVFTLKKSLAIHRRLIHNIGKIIILECDFCKRTFKHKQHLMQHMSIDHLDPNKYICNICNKEMKNKAALRVHQRFTHNDDDIKYPCDVCEKQYKNIRCLRAHIRNMHNDSEGVDYACNICNATYENKALLRKHKINVHFVSGSMECTVCHNMFKNRVSLYSHMRYMHSK